MIDNLKLTTDNKHVYANKDAAENKANGHHTKASSNGTISDNRNSNGTKCLNDNDENILV